MKDNDLNKKNNNFESGELILNRKEIHDVNIHLWNQKYYLPHTKVLGL